MSVDPVRSHDTASLSVTGLFTIGIGPSSSHTVGPMRAGAAFAALACSRGAPLSVRCDLFGSLALTGRGHATDVAVLLGLSGWLPETVDPDEVPALVGAIRESGILLLGGGAEVTFAEAGDLVFRKGVFLPGHANALTFSATYAGGEALTRTYYSVGGGVIVVEGETPLPANVRQPHPFGSGAELLAVGQATGLSVADMVWANEEAWRSRQETTAFIDGVRQAVPHPVGSPARCSPAWPGGPRR
jgi:L-serine dehydratase